MSAYILYQNQTIPEKWGGSLGICSESCTVTCLGSQVFTEEDAEPAESQRAHSSVLHALTSAIRGSGRLRTYQQKGPLGQA